MNDLNSKKSLRASLSQCKEFGNLHEDAISSIVFSRVDRNKVLTASIDGTLKLYDLRMERILKRFEDQDLLTHGSSQGTTKAFISSGGQLAVVMS
jgi:WD40 repeat protein